MQLIIVSGFLGSGKTTLVTALARQMVEKYSRQVILIVNDVGEIGIDGQLMRRLGAGVYELFGGCICCQLGNDLLALLRDITGKYAADLILMEASGIAQPAQIVNLVKRYGPPAADMQVIAVADVIRWLKMWPALEPLLTGQVLAADLILVNKIDAADPDKVAAVVRDIQALQPRGQIMALSASRDGDVAKLAGVIHRG